MRKPEIVPETNSEGHKLVRYYCSRGWCTGYLVALERSGKVARIQKILPARAKPSKRRTFVLIPVANVQEIAA